MKTVEIEYKEPEEQQTDDVLSKLLKYVIQKHPYLVFEFLKENGMDYPAVTHIPAITNTAVLMGLWKIPNIPVIRGKFDYFPILSANGNKFT